MKIIFASSEVSPFAKTGGLGDVSEALPLALTRLKTKCSVIMPLYALVRKNGYSPRYLKKNIPLEIGGRDLSFDLLCLEHKKARFYFIKNDSFYKREGLYGTPKGDYPDNAVRFAFFAKAILASTSYIGKPDILHCNDWQTALCPLFLKTVFRDDPALKGIKVLFTIHNMAYQGLFDKTAMPVIGLPEELYAPSRLEFYGRLSFMKGGIIYSDAISTVSRGYAREILTQEFGCGLDHLLRARRRNLYGILNGADYSTWHPETDRLIIKNYGKRNLKPKIECKKDLSGEFNIPFKEDAPLVGMITRFAEQKGIDIVIDAMDGILNMGADFVILGTGQERYNTLVNAIARRHKKRIGARVAFDNRLAHKIEAGCDMFLMPSRYEPCGLNQMYSLKYATIPVVRATGGLSDTIEDFDPLTKKGNGFTFKDAARESMLGALRRAVDVFKDKKTWKALQENAIKCDFSWKASAKRYIELYKTI